LSNDRPQSLCQASFSSTEELSQGGGHLASQPSSWLGRGGQLHRPLGEGMTQNKSQERTPRQEGQSLPGPTGQRPLSGSRARSSGRPHPPQSSKGTGGKRTLSPLNPPKLRGQRPGWLWIHLLGVAQGLGVQKRPEFLAGLKKTPRREGGKGEALGGFARHILYTESDLLNNKFLKMN